MPQVWSVRRAIARTPRSALEPAAQTKTAERASRPLFLERERSGSGAAPPQAAVAPRRELQVVLVAGPLFVLRQLDLLLRRLPAFPFARRHLPLRLGGLQESERVFGVLLRS